MTLFGHQKRAAFNFVFFIVFMVFCIASSQAQTTVSIASLSFPLDGMAQVEPTVVFTWNPISNVQAYYLYVGSAPGLKDIYDSAETGRTSLTVRVPTGAKIYARLYTEISNTWHAAPDIAFTTVAPSAVISPSNQASRLSPSVTFSWSQATGASAYYLYVGTSPGAKDIIDSGEIHVNQLTRALTGGAFYARIYTLINTKWYASSDVSFSVAAPPKPSTLVSPTNGASLLSASPISFTWSSVSNASVYYLYVGTAPGLNDIVNSREITTTQLTRSLQPGTYFARIYTEIAQVWYPSPDVSFFVTGGSALAFPTNNATGIDPYIKFIWPPYQGATAYSLNVGTIAGGSDALATGPITATSFQTTTPLQSNTTYFSQLGTLVNGSWVYNNSTFSTGTGTAHLLSPTDGSTNVDPFSTLNWNLVSAAQAYYVYVGSQQGLKDIYDSAELNPTTNSLWVPTFQVNTQYFVRLYTEKNSQWFFVDSAFQTGTGISQMVYPPDGATDVDPALPFRWSSDPRALAYFISVGSSPGGNDIYSSGETLDTSRLVSLPSSGRFYITLSSKRPEGWKAISSSFAVGDFVAHLTNPADQSIANIDSQFTWTTRSDADTYYLKIGTSKGAQDVYDSGELTANNISVSHLVPGMTYFARLFTHRLGVWRYSDTSFLAGQGSATLSDPEDGATISPFETFTWDIPQFAGDAYMLTIGTTPGAHDIYNSGTLQSTSVKPYGLDFGQTYYATLFTLKDNVWHPVNSTFNTYDQTSLPNGGAEKANFYSQIQEMTSDVRMMADPTTNLPVQGSPLDLQMHEDKVTVANCSQYALTLEVVLRNAGILSRIRGITLTGTSTESHTTLEYYDPFLQKWSIADPTFGILYFDPATQIGQSVEEVQQLVLASNFAGIHVDPVTNYGDSVLRTYYLDPLTLYVNVTPPETPSPIYGPQANSPLQFLQEVPIQNIEGKAGTYIFAFSTSSDQAQLGIGSRTADQLPADGTLFSSAIILPSDWSILSAPSDLRAFTVIRPVY